MTSKSTRLFVDFGSPDCTLVDNERIILIPLLSARPLQTRLGLSPRSQAVSICGLHGMYAKEPLT